MKLDHHPHFPNVRNTNPVDLEYFPEFANFDVNIEKHAECLKDKTCLKYKNKTCFIAYLPQTLQNRLP